MVRGIRRYTAARGHLATYIISVTCIACVTCVTCAYPQVVDLFVDWAGDDGMLSKIEFIKVGHACNAGCACNACVACNAINARNGPLTPPNADTAAAATTTATATIAQVTTLLDKNKTMNNKQKSDLAERLLFELGNAARHSLACYPYAIHSMLFIVHCPPTTYCSAYTTHRPLRQGRSLATVRCSPTSSYGCR